MTEQEIINGINQATTTNATMRAYYNAGAWCAEHDVDFDCMEDHYSHDELSDAVYMRSTSTMREFFAIGFDGYDYPQYVTGYRYGHIPQGGQSYNYRDDVSERGVSIVAVNDGAMTQDMVSLAFVQCGRPVVTVTGYLHPGATGSDGEPLLLLAKETGR